MLLSFLIVLALFGKLAIGAEIKKHVQNSVYPYDLDPPSYNIESWVKELHLQQCALVEVGDKYYAIFVESRPRRYDHERGIKEYFLGLCDDDTLNKWSFCAANLQRKRADDCNFYTKNMYNTRVHRRLCDLTLLAMNAPQCDCSHDLSDSKLFKVQGFPTCFKPPLPTSLCGDNNVCGLAGCSPRTINKRVHSIKCDKKCNENQPFCEPCDKKSSYPRQIRSFWTDWSNPYCTDSTCVSQFDEAICINSETGHGDIDCLGPGTSCCTPELQNCKCHVYEEGGATKVFRTFSVPMPEIVEYMSEEDFINSIPLRYLKEEFHNYPGYSPRSVRSNFGYALKHTLAHIYDTLPFQFDNKNRRKKCLKKFKDFVLRPFTYKRSSSTSSLHKGTSTTLPTIHTVGHIDSSTGQNGISSTLAHTHSSNLFSSSEQPLSTSIVSSFYQPHSTTSFSSSHQSHSTTLFSPPEHPHIPILPTTTIDNYIPLLPLTTENSIHSELMSAMHLPKSTKLVSTNVVSEIPKSMLYTPPDELLATSTIMHTLPTHPPTFTTSNTPPKLPVTNQSTEEQAVSVIHEINVNPLDTFSSTGAPSDCETCKRNIRIARPTRPHVNTNGIHHKSRVHGHNQQRYQTSKDDYSNHPWCQARKQRQSFSKTIVYPKSSVIYKAVHLKKSKIRKNAPKDEEKSDAMPDDVCTNDGKLLIDGPVNQTLNGSTHEALREKLSYDLIFDDSEGPHEESYMERNRKGAYFAKLSKRQFDKSMYRAAYESVTPVYSVLLKRGERQDVPIRTKDHDAHIENHFRTRSHEDEEYIPKFGPFFKDTKQTKKKSKINPTFPEIRFDDYAGPEDVSEDTNYLPSQNVFVTLSTPTDEGQFHTGETAEPKRQRGLSTKQIDTITNLQRDSVDITFFPKNKNLDDSLRDTSPKSWECDTIPVSDYGYTTNMSQEFHQVREDDEEDAMEIEERKMKNRPDRKTIWKDYGFNDYLGREKKLFGDKLGRPTKKTKIRITITGDSARATGFEEDLDIIVTTSPLPVKSKETDIIKDVNRPEGKKKNQDIFNHCIGKFLARREILRRRIDQIARETEEISDDDDVSYDDDEDVALDYGQDDDEKVTTTENMHEKGETNNVDVKITEQGLGAVTVSLNSSELKSKASYTLTGTYFYLGVNYIYTFLVLYL